MPGLSSACMQVNETSERTRACTPSSPKRFNRPAPTSSFGPRVPTSASAASRTIRLDPVARARGVGRREAAAVSCGDTSRHARAADEQPLRRSHRRARELELAAREAASGRPVLVLLGGDSGIGKTRLVGRVRAASAGDALVLRGECRRAGRRRAPLRAAAERAATARARAPPGAGGAERRQPRAAGGAAAQPRRGRAPRARRRRRRPARCACSRRCSSCSTC